MTTSDTSTEERCRTVDARLVPAALAVWAATLLGLYQGWRLAAVLASLSLSGALGVWLLARSRRWCHGALAVLVLVGIAAAGVAARTHQLERHPLRVAAASGEHTTVRIELASTPKPLHGASYGARKAEDRALVRATVSRIEAPGPRVAVGGTVLLLVPTRSWSALLPGQEATVEGTAVPARSGELIAAVIQVFDPPARVVAPPPWQRVADVLRDDLRNTANAVLSPGQAGLLPGLVVGETAGIPAEVSHDFEQAGLAHLTAVSGANLAIVCGAVLVLLHLLGAGPVLSAAGAGIALIGFVLLAGPEPSVLRAAMMGAIGLLALAVGRQRSTLPALAGSVLSLLLVSPGLATDAGFGLSVAATAGLVLLAPTWSAALRARGVPRGWAEALAAPTAAHVVTAPLIAGLSGEVSGVAVLANLVVEPVVAPVTVLGVAATVLAPLASWVAIALVWLAAPALWWILTVAHRAALLPGSTIEWPSGATGGVLLAVLGVTTLIALRWRRSRWTLAVLVFLVALVLIPVREFAPGWPVRDWSMVACDVGQGDGLVLATGNPGEAVVVDTGPDPALSAECLRRLGVRRIPLVILTHLHADHVSGLPKLLADYRVGEVGMGALHEPAWAMSDIERAARTDTIPVVRLAAGQRVRWPGLILEVLGPRGSLARTNSAGDANDASVVLKATTPAGRILLTGDIELAGQAQLMASGADLGAEILKIPHHGSRYTSPRFLRAVHPRLAVISVGEGNSYGHPSPVLLSMLRRAGVPVLRTDREGDIAVVPGETGPRTASRGDPVRVEDR